MGQWIQQVGGRHFAWIFRILLESSEHGIPSSALQRTDSASRISRIRQQPQAGSREEHLFLLSFPAHDLMVLQARRARTSGWVRHALHVSSVYLEGKEYTGAAAINCPGAIFFQPSLALTSGTTSSVCFKSYPQVASGIRIGAARFSTQLAVK